MFRRVRRVERFGRLGVVRRFGRGETQFVK
jgi:hypothetical protein